MSWRTLLGLVACNAVWATNPLMGKQLLKQFPPLQVSWLRYGSALVAALVILALLALLGAVQAKRKQGVSARQAPGAPGRHLPTWIMLTGLFTFFGSGVAQYTGLALSTSTANALLVALEPLFAVLLAWILLGEVPRRAQAMAFTLAVGGFLLLSNVKPHVLQSFSLFNVGNLLILAALPMEAFYTITSRKVAGRIAPLPFFTLSLLAGFGALTVYVFFSSGFPSFSELSIHHWGAVLWMGPLGTTITYAFWALALVQAPVAAVCLTLFVQPILGAVFGIFLLGEQLDLWQIAGALLILGALTLQTHLTIDQNRRTHG